MQKISTDKDKINEILTRGVREIYTTDELREKLLLGKQLHLKLGTDVTGPLLHLGHTVVHRKLRDFQELGHKVTLIIGDFTTLVGDHSDKVDMRAEKDSLNISADERNYKEQFFKTVFSDQTEIRHNSEWLTKLNFNDVINLSKQFTIAQMLEREAFAQRFNKKSPIGMDEFLYPLMQGYDSVALKCDVEFGGTDQTFNLLAGRKLMPVFGLDPQSAMVMKFKKILAKDIVTFYHGQKKAVEAEKEFENTVQNKEVTETNTTEVSNRGKMSVLEFLKLSGASKSNSHIKEVIKQGGVEVDGKKATDFNKVLDFKSGMVVKFGKRTYFRVK